MELSNWISHCGFSIPDVILDGKIHRFKKPGKKNKNCWYVGFQVPIKAFIIGDWSTGEKFEWKEKLSNPYSKEDLDKLKKQQKEAIKKAEEERTEEQKKAALIAEEFIGKASPQGNHKYLEQKKVNAYGAYFLGSDLIIPTKDIDGNIHGYQKILENGDKYFLKGQRVNGTCHKIPGETDTIFICEGYATGATIHRATNKTVYCAFNANNLKNVALEVKTKHAESNIIIAGDDDYHTPDNPGKTKAQEAATAINAKMVLPNLYGELGTDFNDLQTFFGLGKVKEQLSGVDTAVEQKKSVSNVVSMAKARQEDDKDDESKKKFSDIENEIVEWLHNGKVFDPSVSLDFEFKIVRPEDSAGSVILTVKDRLAKVVTKEVAAGKLRDYLHSLPKQLKLYKIDSEKCLKIIKTLTNKSAHMLTMPKGVGFKSDPDILMRRLDFDPIKCSEEDLPERAPVFFNMLKKISNATALLARIGSIFDENADRKQSVWIYGPKDSGKSQISWLLEQVSPNFVPVGAQDYQDKNFKAMFLGKRVALVQEASATFIRSDVFKSLTGDGVHSINQKYMPVFNTDISVLFFFFSNYAPEIPNDDSLIERVIACRFTAAVAEDEMVSEHEFRQKLIKEMPWIMGAAVNAYESNGRHRRIVCDKTDILDAVDDYEEDFREFLDQHIKTDPGGLVSFSEMASLFEMGRYFSNQDKWKLKRILMSAFGAKKRVMFISYLAEKGVTKRGKVWEGINFVGVAKERLTRQLAFHHCQNDFGSCICDETKKIKRDVAVDSESRVTDEPSVTDCF